MALKSTTATTAEPISEGLQALLQNLIKENPQQAMELLAKLQAGQGNEMPVKQDLEPDPEDEFFNREYRGFGKKGEKPKAVKINIFDVPGEGKWVSLQLGEKPKVHVLRGVDWIIPAEYMSVLNDSVVQTFEHIPLQMPDPETGNVFRTVPITRVRFPYQFLGEVPWDEYEDFRKKLAQDGFGEKKK